MGFNDLIEKNLGLLIRGRQPKAIKLDVALYASSKSNIVWFSVAHDCSVKFLVLNLFIDK